MLQSCCLPAAVSHRMMHTRRPHCRLPRYLWRRRVLVRPSTSRPLDCRRIRLFGPARRIGLSYTVHDERSSQWCENGIYSRCSIFRRLCSVTLCFLASSRPTRGTKTSKLLLICLRVLSTPATAISPVMSPAPTALVAKRISSPDRSLMPRRYRRGGTLKMSSDALASISLSDCVGRKRSWTVLYGISCRVLR